MKLLFDQNLSYKLISKLSDIFPDSSHVKFHDLSFEGDLVIRNFALHQDFTIVTQDSDFYDLAMLMGSPPKIIWIRSGNTSTKYIENLLRNNIMLIHHWVSDKDLHCLELM